MSDEEQIGGEMDRAIRAVLMGMGQVGEQVARRQAQRADAQRLELERNQRARAEQTRAVAEQVHRTDFWRHATPEQVGDVAAFTAAAAQESAAGATAHEQVRVQVASRYGLDADVLAGLDREVRDQALREAFANTAEARFAVDNRDTTRAVYDRVKREEFWRQAGPEQVADTVEYTRRLQGHDRMAAEAHSIAGEQLRARHGIDLAALERELPPGERQRHALMHALDDQAAARRERDEADQDATAAENLERKADVDEELGRPVGEVESTREEADELRAESREHDAQGDVYQASADLEQGDERFARGHHPDDLGAPYQRTTDGELQAAPAAAATARKQAATNFPEPAGKALGRAHRKGAMRGRKQAGRGAAAGKVHELSR